MQKDKMNGEIVFNYLKLGVDIAKIVVLAAHYEEEVVETKEYIELVEIYNKRLKCLEIDYCIEGVDFFDHLKMYERELISKQFKNPFLNEKISLFEIGYYLMLIPVMELGGETEELNDSKLHDVFQRLLKELKVPTYEMLDILFDKQFDSDRRLMLFTYELCNYFDNKQKDIDDNNHIDSSNITAIGGNIIWGNGNVVTNSNTINISYNQIDSFFSMLENEIKILIEDNKEILQKLTELQQEKGKIAYNKKYVEFISLMADYFTILSPFLQILSTFLK